MQIKQATKSTNTMKNSTIILLFTACIGCSELFPLSAQETKKGTIPAKCITSEKQMQQLEESLNNISADLQKENWSSVGYLLKDT